MSVFVGCRTDNRGIARLPERRLSFLAWNPLADSAERYVYN